MKIQHNAPNIGANDRFVNRNTTEGSEVEGTKLIDNFPNQIIEDIQEGYIKAAGLEPSATDTTQVKQATDIFIDQKLNPVKEDIVNTKEEMATELANTKVEIESDLKETKAEIDEKLEKYGGTHPIYTVRIDTNSSDPKEALIYMDDAEGMEASYGNNGEFVDNGWQAILEEVCGMKPCLLRNGVVQYYLDKNDFTKKENGEWADITSGADGDVMIEYTKCYIRFREEANYKYLSISKSKYEGFSDWAFSYCGSVRDKFYIGAYLGFVTGSMLYSRSNVQPTASTTIGNFRAYARNRGDGYEQMPYNKLIFLQALYLIRFKSLDSQTALGKGWISQAAATKTGATDLKGMCFGSDDNLQIKCNGLEDFFGNLVYWIEGISTSGGKVFIKDGAFDDYATGEVCRVVTSDLANVYPSDVSFTDKLGFLAKGTGGSDSTYYCDNQYLCAGSSYVASFGGSYGDGLSAGAFRLYVGTAVSYSHASFGARLAYCK